MLELRAEAVEGLELRVEAVGEPTMMSGVAKK